MRAFEAFGLQPQLLQAISDLGYETPTPIQSAVLPVLLAGQDVIGQAQTGTGKTAAFALPLLQHMEPGLGIVQALVLAPTRELALQVSQAIADFGRFLPLRVLTVYGGQPYGPQIKQLKQGVDIVVGTPGRLIDLMGKQALDLSNIRILVLDEADEMLSMGFIEDIETILAATPSARLTALFSATMPPRIRKLADQYMRQARVVEIAAGQRTASEIEQRYYLVNEADKVAALTRLFETEGIESALIFTRTREGTGTVANELTLRGFPAEPLNGDLAQDARERVLGRFRDRRIQVLVATDVAARGLDIDGISHVFNFDLPQFPDSYVHRVGRTGRAGKAGVAISLVTVEEIRKLRRIEAYTRQPISPAEIPTEEEILGNREKLLIERTLVWLKRGRCRKERELVEALVAEGFDPLDIAAVTLKMARAEEKQRPIHPVAPVSAHIRRDERPERRTPRAAARPENLGADRFQTRVSHEAGMVRLIFKAGRDHDIRPADVVGTIAMHADIPGKLIGAIKVQRDHTLVDVPENYVDQVLQKSGSYRVRRQDVQIEKA